MRMGKAANRPQRHLRVAEQIGRDLAQMIQRELPSSRAGLITVSGVELTADYAHAKVYFTVLGAEPQVATQVLNDKAGYFHSLLFKQLSTHTVPTLKFVHDDSVERGFALDQLIGQIHTDGDAPSQSGSLKPKE
ncbi:MAG TPA: 30S ribosome-binding factor RbfA [Burkholderiaceae bacterium]|nr:30S ribosome-binding factor RbfA [Burkholderiaceae bacterium]